MVRDRMTTFHLWEVLSPAALHLGSLKQRGEIDPPQLGVILFPVPGNVHGASLKQSELI